MLSGVKDYMFLYVSLVIVFGSGWVEVTREWRKLHNEELSYLYCSHQYCSGDKIENNQLSGVCTAYGGEERGIKYFGGEMLFNRGTARWRSWLRHCAKNRKVAGSIPDGVIGIFR